MELFTGFLYSSFQLSDLWYFNFSLPSQLMSSLFTLFTGQGLSHDIQHISPSLMVDGARPWLPSNTSDRLTHCPRRPPRHHCLGVSSGLPVHRGVEFSYTDPSGGTYQNTHTHTQTRLQTILCLLLC